MSFSLVLAASPLGQSNPEVDRALEKVTEHQDYLGALADLKKLSQASHSDPLLHYLIGVCYTGIRDYASAVDSFQMAHEKGLDTWELWLNFGIARSRLGKNSLAREDLERVLRTRPSEPRTLFHMGRLNLRTGRYAEAEENFRKVLSLEPTDRGALFSLGTSLLKQGKEKEGRDVLEYHRKTNHLESRVNTLKVLASSPNPSAKVFADLGDVYLELREPEKAVQSYETAEQMEPGTPLTALGRGKISYSKGDLTATAGHLILYLDKGGMDCEAYLLLGMVRRAQRSADAVRKVLENGIQRCPTDTRLLANLAQLEVEVGNLAALKRLAKKILEVDSRAAAGPFFMAIVHFRENRLEDAESSALKVLEISDQNPSYHRLLQQIYQAKGETGKARLHAERAQALLKQNRYVP